MTQDQANSILDFIFFLWRERMISYETLKKLTFKDILEIKERLTQTKNIGK